MKKRMAAIMFVICVIMLIMLTAGFEQSDKLSTAEYLIYSALALGGMYISQKAAKKENARAPSESSSTERGTGARASTEPAAEKADARPSVRSRLMALQAAAERDGTAPTKDTVREAIQKAMPTRE